VQWGSVHTTLKAVPLQATKALGERGGRAPTHFRLRHSWPRPRFWVSPGHDFGWAPDPVWTEAAGKILSPLPGIELRSPGRRARSQTLYWLSYPARTHYTASSVTFLWSLVYSFSFPNHNDSTYSETEKKQELNMTVKWGIAYREDTYSPQTTSWSRKACESCGNARFREQKWCSILFNVKTFAPQRRKWKRLLQCINCPMFAVRLWITTSPYRWPIGSLPFNRMLCTPPPPRTALRTFTPSRDQLVICGQQ
jgi:hypothetical protein